MNRMSLCGAGWKMTDCSSGESYAAVAPCSVLSVLLEAGVVADPYYRENEKSLLPLFERDFIFERVFTVDGEYMQMDRLELVFYGLDTVTEICLNGERLAVTRNMHRTYRFSVKEMLRSGANELQLH
ncbi:MAG: glycoside hydrolase family 2 protein, partial [Lachnospiraceae bacterium]|nr:glycoside hydrolase family 2 protein [Lachnospiraceae bacterium]